MNANKPHKGLLKRVRVTKTGKVKHKSANSKHLKSHKSGKHLRRLRKDRYISNAEAQVVQILLHRRVRGRDQPRTALKRSPSPEQRHAAEAAEAATAAASKGGEK